MSVFCADPIQNQEELEGVIDSNLFQDGDIVADLEHGKTYIVNVKRNITKTTLTDTQELNNLVNMVKRN
jgi:hypothetical protein